MFKSEEEKGGLREARARGRDGTGRSMLSKGEVEGGDEK